ncbi:hypothetical protein, partial [Clostridium paraputrificum]|uniref:hypothetical protein n=2 Tax=Clostridiaceae TaxID=31979 RepID=UPI00232D9540
KDKKKMKFYEFNQHEYYGLVLAIDERWAKRGYEDIVADLEDEEKDISPDIITEEQALERYKKGKIDGCNTVEEKINDFNGIVKNFEKYVSKGEEPYMVLLIDGALL